MNDTELTKTLCAMSPNLRRAALRLTGCPHAAEDLAQETMLKMLQRLEKSPAPENLRAYALTTLRNLTRSRWRSIRPTEPLTDDIAAPCPTRRTGCIWPSYAAPSPTCPRNRHG